MPPNLIASAVPIFIAAIVLERLVARRRDAYRWGAAIADLDVGITSQVIDVGLKLVGFFVYSLVFTRFRLFTFRADSISVWVVGLLGIDLLYYWWHRASHVVNALWAVH